MDGAFLHSLRLKLIDYMCAPDPDESVAAVKARMEEFYQVFHLITAPMGNRLVYRVRRIEPTHPHIHFDDVWCPAPDKILKIGRANDIGQAIFYGALDPMTAVAETRIIPGEKYSLATFQLRNSESHESVIIRQAEHIDIPNPELSRYGVELSKFMVHEFTRIVPQGSEHLYRRSCALAQMLLETPSKDSLVYPSVQKQDGVNIALKSDAAVRRLDLQQVLTCEMTPEKDHRVLEIKMPNSNGDLIPHNPGFPLPCRAKFTGTPMSFSTSFLNAKIPNRDDILERIKKRAAR